MKYSFALTRRLRQNQGGGTTTGPTNARRFSRNLSEFRISQTDPETRFLATGNYYGIHLERHILVLDWLAVHRECCGHEAEGTPDGGSLFAKTLDEVAMECPRCGKKSLVPKAFAPDLVASRERRIVIEIYGKVQRQERRQNGVLQGERVHGGNRA